MDIGQPENVQCANVRNLSERTTAHYPPAAAQSSTHSCAHYQGISLKALARQRLQEIDSRTLPRTLDRTLPETRSHITAQIAAAMCAPSDRLQQLVAEACKGLVGYITTDSLLAKLALGDVAELEAANDPLPFLRSLAVASVWTDFRRQGIAPPGWDKPAHCARCGPVFLWATIHVSGCPWCWNRLHGLRIPRP